MELDGLELKREGEVNEADSPTSINTELTPSLAPNDSNSDLTASGLRSQPAKKP